ncbi:MAG: hypothetical protein SFU99_16280 [Saprospiraceae bacterium]|nr:hypothetical protein [Saprospiraceae bacterium]
MTVELKILSTVRQLSEIQKAKLLDFMEVMVGRATLSSPQRLLEFAGSIPKTDLQEMQEAIEKDCGKIDYNEW